MNAMKLQSLKSVTTGFKYSVAIELTYGRLVEKVINRES